MLLCLKINSLRSMFMDSSAFTYLAILLDSPMQQVWIKLQF